VLARKGPIALAIAAIVSVHLQVLVGVTVLVAALAAHLRTSPFEHTVVNHFETLSILTSIATFYAALFTFVGDSGVGPSVFAGSAIVGVNIVYFVVFVLLILLTSSHRFADAFRTWFYRAFDKPASYLKSLQASLLASQSVDGDVVDFTHDDFDSSNGGGGDAGEQMSTRATLLSDVSPMARLNILSNTVVSRLTRSSSCGQDRPRFETRTSIGMLRDSMMRQRMSKMSSIIPTARKACDNSAVSTRTSHSSRPQSESVYDQQDASPSPSPCHITLIAPGAVEMQSLSGGHL
jgi:hypothetical protein